MIKQNHIGYARACQASTRKGGNAIVSNEPAGWPQFSRVKDFHQVMRRCTDPQHRWQNREQLSNGVKPCLQHWQLTLKSCYHLANLRDKLHITRLHLIRRNNSLVEHDFHLLEILVYSVDIRHSKTVTLGMQWIVKPGYQDTQDTTTQNSGLR